MKLSEIKEKIGQARYDALREAKSDWTYKYQPSRGQFLCTGDANGQCAPNVEAECPTWDGNLRSIKTLIEKVKQDYPAVTKIYLSGGYDGAESPYAYQQGDYEPWIASWSVPIWERA